MPRPKRLQKYSRAELEEAAQEYLDKYAGWANSQINSMLRFEYDGAYLTNRTLDKLRKRGPRPRFHPAAIIVSGNEIDILLKEGFLKHEARDLLKSLGVRLDHPAMVAYRKQRIKWWSDRLAQGWDRVKIRKALERYYSAGERGTVWDDFRAGYDPKTHKHISPTAYRIAVKKQRKARKVMKPMYHLLKTKPTPFTLG